MGSSGLLKYGTDFVRLSNTLTDFCQKAQTDCHGCPFKRMRRELPGALAPWDESSLS